MTKKQTEQIKFLEQQLEWIKNRDNILAKIENKLYEMKDIAQYARDHELSSLEINQLNERLNELQSEIHLLEKQLELVVH